VGFYNQKTGILVQNKTNNLFKNININSFASQINEAIKNYSLSAKVSVADIEKRIGKGPFAAQLASNNAIKLILDNKVVE
jgi:hypothetical protein